MIQIDPHLYQDHHYQVAWVIVIIMGMTIQLIKDFLPMIEDNIILSHLGVVVVGTLHTPNLPVREVVHLISIYVITTHEFLLVIMEALEKFQILTISIPGKGKDLIYSMTG